MVGTSSQQTGVSARRDCFHVIHNRLKAGEAESARHSKLLILDLDETLIFASETKLAYSEDFRVDEYFVYKRPGLDRFIEFAFLHFKVAVWTSSQPDCAQAVIRRIFPDPALLKFAWARQRCSWKSDPELAKGYWIKDLKKVSRMGLSLSRVLVVDDSPRKLQRSYGNYIRVLPFEGDPSDDELSKLERYLLRLRDVANVRSLEKRTWRHKP